jgi:excisionase family DNA binding protein
MKNIMENPFDQIEQRLNVIEDLLNTMLNRLEQIEKPSSEMVGNVDECSGWIKKSPSTIYKYVSEKKIPYIKSGKKVLFDKDEILEWLKTGAEPTLEDIRKEVDIKLGEMKKSKPRA